MKTVKFITLGCKVNQYDTQSIRERFIQAGFTELEDSQPADIYVINTCTVTHKADSDSLSLIRKVKKENSGARIIVTGCLTELNEDEIKKTDSESIIVKNKDKNRILVIPKKEDSQLITHNSQLITFFKGHTRAFLKIQDGCNNFCSYCKVPLVRGVSKSKPLNEIVIESERLLKNGFKEIVLCGICLGDYGKDLQPHLNLVDVIEALEHMEGLLRIRLSSIEASDILDALIGKIVKSQKLCRHLHIPIQSGDDGILKKMNRNYCRQDYLNLIKKIKSYIPEIAITTDVLVGFPGESDGNFQNTVKLIKEISPLRTHIFSYSKREGTQAAKNFNEKLNYKIIKERVNYLQNIAQNCSLDYKRQSLNKNMDALIEGDSKESKDYWQGYTGNYIKVLVKSNLNLKNKIIRVRLKKINKGCVEADLL